MLAATMRKSLDCAGLVCAGLPAAAQVPPQTKILGEAKERQPGYGPRCL